MSIEQNLPTSRKIQLGGIALLVALGGADIATTYLGLQQGLSEGSPLAHHLMDNFGMLGGVIGLDSIAIASVITASEVIHRRFGFAATNLVIGVANAVAADNVINNLHLML